MAKEKSQNSLGNINIFAKLICLAVIIWLANISYFACVFFFMMMLPSIITNLIDKGTGKFTSKTVTACNFIASIPYLVDIGLAYEKNLYIKDKISEIETWLVIYGFSSVGWMMVWLVPNLTSSIFMMQADYRIEKLKKKQKEIIEEWGEFNNSESKNGEASST